MFIRHQNIQKTRHKSTYPKVQSINQSIKYYFIVLPKVDQRAGQLCLPQS